MTLFSPLTIVKSTYDKEHAMAHDYMFPKQVLVTTTSPLAVHLDLPRSNYPNILVARTAI